MRKPSAIGSDILSEAEVAMMNGMSPDPKDRTKSIQELRTVLENLYPDLTEEERQERVRKRMRNRRIIATVSIAIVCVMSMLIYLFRAHIYLSRVETHEFTLYGIEMTDEDFKENAKIVKERLRLLAGDGRFLWAVDHKTKQISVKTALEIYGDTDPHDLSRLYIIRPMKAEVFVDASIPHEPENTDQASANNNYESIGILDHGKDISSVAKIEGGFLLTFSPEVITEYPECFNSEGNLIHIMFDSDIESDTHLEFVGKTIGDGGVFFSESENPLITIVPEKIVKSAFMETELSSGFHAYTELQIIWESPTSSTVPGMNQVANEQIAEDALILRYKPWFDLTYSDFTPEKQRASRMIAVSIMKNRLDALQIPYAFGAYRYDGDRFCVKVPMKSVFYEPIRWLGENDTHLYIGDKSTPLLRKDFSHIVAFDEENGAISLFVEKLDKEGVIDYLKTIQARGETVLYLYTQNEKCIAYTDIESALRSVDESGIILFQNHDLYVNTSADDNHNLARFFSVFCQQDFSFNGIVKYYIDAYIVTNQEGRNIASPEQKPLIESVPQIFTEQLVWNELKTELETGYAKSFQSSQWLHIRNSFHQNLQI